MTDTATTRYGARKQSLGSNTNTWGDDKLNHVIDLFDRGSKGYEAIALTGDATLSWTNYSASNSGQVATVKFTGSLVATAIVTVPSKEWQCHYINAAGASVTVKTSAGTGITIQNGYAVTLQCDGTNVIYATPTQFGGNLYLGGQLKNVTAGTAALDVYNKTQVDAAIAAASSASVIGTVKVDSLANAAFLGAALTASGDASITDNGDSLDIVSTPYWTAPRYVDNTDSPVTAVDRDIIVCDTSGGAITINLPASGRVKIVDQTGNSPTYNITLTPAGGSTITFGTIDTAYFAGEYRFDGTSNWDLT